MPSELFGREITRRVMIRGAVGVGAALGVPLTAAAQDGTPPAGSCGVALKTRTPFISVDGNEVGQLSVDEIVDPFTGYRSNYPPARGSRFVLITMTLKNTGTQVWGFDPNAVTIQDSDGFLLRPVGVDLGEAPVVQGISGQNIEAGASVTGVIGYAAVKGTTLRRIFYNPASDRLLLLAELA